jgi:hypothetical protein
MLSCFDLRADTHRGIGGLSMANPTIEIRRNDATSDASVARVDMKLEVVVIPVSDVDRGEHGEADHYKENEHGRVHC